MKLPENTSIKWVAGLSNGETIVEGKGIAKKVKGEDSPWWKLQSYIKEKELKITSMGIWEGDKHYNLPSNDPKFGGEIPISYNYGRRVEYDDDGTNMKYFIFVEAILKESRVQLWLDQADTNKSWVTVAKPKKEGKKSPKKLK